MNISIIIPAYNESLVIVDTYNALIAVLAELKCKYEIIFVNDGSTDNTADIIKSLHLKNPNTKLINFSRNFGHQIALSAGLDLASGEAVIFMDADLQHPPTLIPDMLTHWEKGFEIVYTKRTNTEGANFFKTVTANIFYTFFRKITGIPLESNVADFRLLDRKVVNIFKNEIRERNRFLRGLTAWVGFKSIGIPYSAAARLKGNSKYNLKKMLFLAVDGISSFSAAPLYLGVILGFIISLLGFLYSIYALVMKFIAGATIPGWSSTVILVAIIGGVQLILIGILGIYIGKIYEEVKQRPLYIIHNSLGFSNNNEK